jgi:hypothetical protein
VVTVRDDGLRTVVAPLAAVCRVEVAVLVDVASGMTLDTWLGGHIEGDPEVLGAAHADVVRALIATGEPADEYVLHQGDRHHLVRFVADPSGGMLALAAVVGGSPWAVRRALKRLREVPGECLTAGPLPAGQDGWGDPSPAGRHRAGAGPVPAPVRFEPGGKLNQVRVRGERAARALPSHSSPAPPSALPPARGPAPFT